MFIFINRVIIYNTVAQINVITLFKTPLFKRLDPGLFVSYDTIYSQTFDELPDLKRCKCVDFPGELTHSQWESYYASFNY